MLNGNGYLAYQTTPRILHDIDIRSIPCGGSGKEAGMEVKLSNPCDCESTSRARSSLAGQLSGEVVGRAEYITKTRVTMETGGTGGLMKLAPELLHKILTEFLTVRHAIRLPNHHDPSVNKLPDHFLETLKLNKTLYNMGLEVLYNNNFSITLPVVTSTPVESYSNRRSFPLSGIRWEHLKRIPHLTFSSDSIPLSGTSDIATAMHVRPFFQCTGEEIHNRFTENERKYSPLGPNEYMILSISNWVSTNVMRAELKAFQKEMEMFMPEGDPLLHALAQDDEDDLAAGVAEGAQQMGNSQS